jgi:hypothetical protein
MTTLVGALAVLVSVVAEGQPAPGPETIAAAAEANVNPIDLLGAQIATGLGAREYLISVGELVVQQPAPPAAHAAPPYGAAVARARCIIGEESGGLDVPNRQGSGASGPGQYFASTWARHTALYRAATGYTGTLSLHVYDHVLAVMSWILAAIPHSRTEWSVGGC